ncbi:TonB-dependent receptor [Pontibacter beigongshangensis]|uniref:TonB-dependent receptor n=1 Tax=Pontibacter beigongshangensis TaxID=2574733 RepID=UPI00164EE6C1|nr:TonB-dependent receptor [Pontibacter beigongshangensis]
MIHIFLFSRRTAKPFLVLLFLLFSGSKTIAQQGAVAGHVATTDSQAAMGVGVALRGTTVGTTTDAQGNFAIDKIRPGTYQLVVYLVGLEPQEQRIAVEAHKTTRADFVLRESATRLQEVVVQGTRSQFKADLPSATLRSSTPLLETPQNIQVITEGLLKGQQSFDMSEAVARNVSGVTAQEHWGNYTRLNMRGARIAPFRNGMNVESTWGPLSEDMSFVERIEFVKGPAGFMLANGDPAGFYNVVTKKPTGVNRKAVTFTFGSFNTYRATADLDGTLTTDGKLQYRLNVMGQLKDSWRDYEYNNRYSIAPVLKYKFSDRTSLTAEYTHQYSRMSAIGSAYVFSARGYKDLPRNFTIADPDLEPSDMHDNSAFLLFEHQLNSDWKLTAQAAYFRYNQVGSSLWVKSVDENGDMQRTTSSWDAQNNSKFGQVYINGTVKTGTITHRILGGLDYGDKEYLADWNQYFELDQNRPFNIYKPVYGFAESGVPTFDRSKPLRERAGGNMLSQRYGAVYVQDELGFFENNLRLTLAGRYTKARTQQYATVMENEKLSPRVGLSASLSSNTSLYALYDQAFIPQNGVLADGGKVKPITGNNLEVGFKRDWLHGRFNTTVSVYQITKNNQLVSDPNSDPSQNFSLQLGQTKTQGVELDVRGELAKGLNLMVNYAYTDSEITKDTDASRIGLKVSGYAEHVTNTWLTYTLQKGPLQGLGFSGGYQWQLNRFPWFVADGTPGGLPDYFRLDGGLSYQLKKISLGLTINNLLDDYLYAGSPYDFDYNGSLDGYYWQTEAPRNYRVSIGYKF